MMVLLTLASLQRRPRSRAGATGCTCGRVFNGKRIGRFGLARSAHTRNKNSVAAGFRSVSRRFEGLNTMKKARFAIGGQAGGEDDSATETPKVWLQDALGFSSLLRILFSLCTTGSQSPVPTHSETKSCTPRNVRYLRETRAEVFRPSGRRPGQSVTRIGRNQS